MDGGLPWLKIYIDIRPIGVQRLLWSNMDKWNNGQPKQLSKWNYVETKTKFAKHLYIARETQTARGGDWPQHHLVERR